MPCKDQNALTQRMIQSTGSFLVDDALGQEQEIELADGLQRRQEPGARRQEATGD